MFKLFKYEIKGRLKIIIIMSVVLLVANLLLLTTFKWEGLLKDSQGFSFSGDTDIDVVSALALLISLVANCVSLVVAFIFGIRILLRDIFEDTKKLLFTLPAKGYVLVGAKLLSAVTEFLIYFFIIMTFAFLHVSKIIQSSGSSIGSVAYLLNDLFYVTILALVGYIFLMVLVYFSIILTKSILKVDRFVTLTSGIVFVILFACIGGLQRFIRVKLPYYVEFQSFAMQKDPSASITQTSITGLIFDLILIAVLFLSASYVVENKLEV